MANLIEYIQSQVYENSTEDISGSIMQQVLTRMASDEGVVNVHTITGQTPFADYNNAQAARDAVPAGFKKLGLIITYKLSSGWYIDEFIGSATSGWSTASNWKCLGPISVSQNASTGKTTITIGSESFDVATQPVSVSQNIETGKEELLIGGDAKWILDNIPQLGSKNLVKSGGVARKEYYLDEIKPLTNLLNTDTRSADGSWCNYTNGQIQTGGSSYADYSYYQPVMVKPNTTYARVLDCGAFGTSFFDEEMNFISGTTVDVFTTPSNAAYAILNTANYVTSHQVLIERNAAYNPTTEGILDYNVILKHGDYVRKADFDELAGHSVTDEILKETIDGLITTGDNIFNGELGELGVWCNYTNGQFQRNQYVTNYKASGYIEIESSTEYSRMNGRGSMGACFFDENKVFISGTQSEHFTTPSNCAYIVINVTSDVSFVDVIVKGNLTITSAAKYPYYNRFVNEKPADLIRIGIGTDYPTIKAGFEYARSKNVGVIITPGTYDLVQEGISGVGYYLPKVVYGYGVTLNCHLQTENWQLSPLNVHFLSEGAEVYGLTVNCTNCRYCIHDDMYGMSVGGYYKNIFKDLKLIHNSAPSTTLIRPSNIGGGFGDYGDVYIENCIMSSQSDVNSDYHSASAETQSKDCMAMFTNCVLNKTITATSIGSSTAYKNKVYVSNCLCGTIPVNKDEGNMQLIAWNNVARN